MYKFIVQHPVKGRITCKAFNGDTSVVGMQMNGGVCVGVTLYGKPVPINEAPEYRHSPTIPTRKVDHLPSCVVRTQGISSHMPPTPPVVPVRYEGHSHHHGAYVAVGRVYETTAEQRMLNSINVAALSKQSPVPAPEVVVLPDIERMRWISPISDFSDKRGDNYNLCYSTEWAFKGVVLHLLGPVKFNIDQWIKDVEMLNPCMDCCTRDAMLNRMR